MAFSMNELTAALPTQTDGDAWVMVIGCGRESLMAICRSGTDTRERPIDHDQGLATQDLETLKVALQLALDRVSLRLEANQPPASPNQG